MSPEEDRAEPVGPSALDRFLVTVLLVAGFAAVPASIAWLATRLVSTRETPPAAFPTESFPAQGFTLQEYRREMEGRLDGLGWVDRDKGIAHVPIQLGMKLVLEHGLPAREEAPPGAKKQ